MCFRLEACSGKGGCSGTGKWEGEDGGKCGKYFGEAVLSNLASHSLVLRYQDWLLCLVGHFHDTFMSSFLGPSNCNVLNLHGCNFIPYESPAPSSSAPWLVPASCLWASFSDPTEQDSGSHMLTLSLLYVPHMTHGKHTHLLLTASAIAQ